MPDSSESRSRSRRLDDAFKVYEKAIDEMLSRALQEQGFPATLKYLKRGRLPGEMITVQEGVVQESATGLFDAALQTNQGRIVLRDAIRTDRCSADPQLLQASEAEFDASADSRELTSDQLLRELTVASTPSGTLICAVELTRFSPSQHPALLSLLWQYILRFRDSNNRDDLVSVGAAIRKYIAIIPMDRMGELAFLLESGHRSQTPIDLEIEVAKMIYCNFEVHPSVAADPHPELTERLWEMAQAYINPRILLRDKHSAAASLAIEAIVSMRSHLAKQALNAAVASPYRWFAELVSDDLNGLCESWRLKNAESAAWLRDLLESVVAHT